MRYLSASLIGLLLLMMPPALAQTAASTATETVSSQASKATMDAVKQQQDAATSDK